jgi:hypothetical protein
MIYSRAKSFYITILNTIKEIILHKNKHKNTQMNTQNFKHTEDSFLKSSEQPPKMTVMTDYDLWNLLFKDSSPQGSHKLSKAEAYFDLVKRHRLATLTKNNNYLDGGILALAKAWLWDRNTVKKFIDSLCSIEAATMEKVGNKTVILITNVSYLPQYGSDA